MNVHSRVVVPIHAPLFCGPEQLEWFARLYDEFCTASAELEVLDHWGGTAPVEVTGHSDAATVEGLRQVWSGRPFFDYKFLCFEAVVNVDKPAVEELLASNNPGMKPSREWDVDALIEQISAESLSHSVANMLLAGHIAAPGSVSTGERYIFAERGFVGTEAAVSLGFDGALRRAKHIGWPAIKAVPLKEVLAWMKRAPGFLVGEPVGSSGRALSALSHLMTRPAPEGEDAVGLMWCMVALEAVYGVGQTHLRQQLVQKAALVLGEPQKHKRAFGAIYDFRSRFVHGDVDFPVAYKKTGATELAFESELAESVQLALAVLLGTLAAMVIRDVHALSFEYRLVDGGTSGV